MNESNEERVRPVISILWADAENAEYRDIVSVCWTGNAAHTTIEHAMVVTCTTLTLVGQMGLIFIPFKDAG